MISQPGSGTRITYAEFLHPSDASGADIFTSVREVPNRDPLCLPGPPADAVGVRFYDQLEGYLLDPSTNTPKHVTSIRLNVTPGVLFYGGTVLTQAQVAIEPTIPATLRPIIQTNMQTNGWLQVLRTPSGMILPYDPNVDSLISF